MKNEAPKKTVDKFESKKENALEMYRRLYLPMRRISKGDPYHTKKRLEIKSNIAYAIHQGDPTLSKHFEELGDRIEKGGIKDRNQFAARISDGISQSSKREPSLLETIQATKEQSEIYNNVAKSFDPNEVEVIRIGSSFWGRNYSVRGKELDNPSDIDLELVMKTIPSNFLDPEIQTAFLKFQKHFKKGTADFCAIKKIISGVEVSFHIMPIETLKKICEFNYLEADKLVTLKEFRVTQKISPKTYRQKNFAGDVFSFSTTPLLVEGGQISEVPLVMIGNHGELVLGVVLNKYLPLPELSKENGLLHQELGKMVNSLRKRKDADKRKLLEKKLSFEFFHTHSEHMPQWIKDQLKTLD